MPIMDGFALLQWMKDHATPGQKMILSNLIQAKDQIFHKLFRADNAAQSDTSGTGLGLYIVKAIVEDIAEGSITFTSAENQGTTFTITPPKTGMKARQGSKPLEK